MSVRSKFRAYYLLTKPGIIRGNAIHVIAGALFASMIAIQWQQVIAVLIGTSLVIASACVANNYMDRGIDARMKRTRTRPSVTGEVPLRHALIYMLALLAAGFAVLIAFTNAWVVLIGALAYFLYVVVYGWAKRATVHSTLVGAVPGALPILAGHAAVSGGLTTTGWLLFVLVTVWQMPHFYAISLFRKKEYEAARLPVMGVVKPFGYVRWLMIGYVLLYIATITLMIALKSFTPAAGLLLLSGGAYWLFVCMKRPEGYERWARKVFGVSLLLTLGLLLASALNVFVTVLT